VYFADNVFDKVQRVSVADLANLDDGFIAFTEDAPSKSLVEDALDGRSLPMIKIGKWSSADTFDATWQSIPSVEELYGLVASKVKPPVEQTAFIPDLISSPDATLPRSIGVQRFFPYAAISFFCLAVVAIWYIIYSSDTPEIAEQEQLVTAPVIIEPLAQLPEAVPLSDAPVLTVKSEWIVPTLELNAPITGELVWESDSLASVSDKALVASIAVAADEDMIKIAVAFQQQALARAAQRQTKFDASYQEQMVQLDNEISSVEENKQHLENALGESSKLLAVMRREADQGSHSWTELKAFEDDVDIASQQRDAAMDKLTALHQRKTQLENGSLDFSNDEMHLALLANAKYFIEIVSKSPASIAVYATQRGTIEHEVASYTLVEKGQSLAIIKDIDGSFFECSIAKSEHFAAYRDSDIFVVLDNGEQYLLDLHSETFGNGVFKYKLKMDVLRYSELFSDLTVGENYDIIFKPR
jgi:hypothetical protein